MTTNVLINILVANGLPIHGNDVLFQQLKRIDSHPQLGGGVLGGLPNGRSPKGGGSFNWNPPKGLLLDPPVGFYKWLALDPRMFVPPLYPLDVVWFEPTNKLPYQKLQYSTFMKDPNVDVRIIIFQKVIKVNGETMEVDIINLFGFTLWNNISEWGNFFI